LVVGTEKVTELVKNNKECLIMLASDISDKTEKELTYYANKGKAVVIRLSYDLKTISHATSTTAGVFATEDKGFCKAILQGGNEIYGD
jgi:ribosomal protein L7Ae-like RNA K-turn-binding protein